MDIPNNIIQAVKETQAELNLGTKKTRKPYMKECTKRILHALGNGLRTASSISNALGEPKAKIVSRLWHMKDQGLVHGEKKQGSKEFKYYLNTEQPKLATLDLTPKKKARKPYTKRVEKVEVVKVINKATQESINQIAELQADNARYIKRISDLEIILTEKEKEVWTLECEVFDKKAVIAYLEGKLALKGTGL